MGRSDLEGGDDETAYVIEAKILTDKKAPITQKDLTKLCHDWATQVIEYADAQGVDLVFLVVFNRTTNRKFIGSGPHIVEDSRFIITYVAVSAMKVTPSKLKGRPLVLRYRDPTPSVEKDNSNPNKAKKR